MREINTTDHFFEGEKGENDVCDSILKTFCHNAVVLKF